MNDINICPKCGNKLRVCCTYKTKKNTITRYKICKQCGYKAKTTEFREENIYGKA